MKITSLILAGGKGTRLFPLTLKTPKPLLEYKGKKLIDYSLEKAVLISDEVVVTTCYKASCIEKYLNYKWPGVKCVKEDIALGTGGSIRFQLNLLQSSNSDVVLILVADHVRRISLKKFVRHHVNFNNDVTILASDSSLDHDSLVVENSSVVDFIKKGTVLRDNSFSSTGEYVFSKNFLCRELLSKETNQFFNLGEDFIEPIIMSRRSKIGTYYVKNWVDIGTLEKLKN